jgi:hypothetical protein
MTQNDADPYQFHAYLDTDFHVDSDPVPDPGLKVAIYNMKYLLA